MRIRREQHQPSLKGLTIFTKTAHLLVYEAFEAFGCSDFMVFKQLSLHGHHLVPCVLCSNVDSGNTMMSGINIVSVDSGCERDFAVLGFLVYRTPSHTLSNAGRGAYRGLLLQVWLVFNSENSKGLLVFVVCDVGTVSVQGGVDGSVQSVLHPGCGFLGGVIGAIGAIQTTVQACDCFHCQRLYPIQLCHFLRARLFLRKEELGRIIVYRGCHVGAQCGSGAHTLRALRHMIPLSPLCQLRAIAHDSQ